MSINTKLAFSANIGWTTMHGRLDRNFGPGQSLTPRQESSLTLEIIEKFDYIPFSFVYGYISDADFWSMMEEPWEKNIVPAGKVRLSTREIQGFKRVRNAIRSLGVAPI